MQAITGRVMASRGPPAPRPTCTRDVVVAWAHAKHGPAVCGITPSRHLRDQGRRVASAAVASATTAHPTTTELTAKEAHASVAAASGTQWLSQAIPHIIKALAQHTQTPLIQWCHLHGTTSQRASFEVQSVPAGVQDWGAVQHKAATSGADALVLVRAVDAPSLVCSSYPPGSGAPPLDCSTCVASPAAASRSSIMGSVDEDCCSGPAGSTQAHKSQLALVARAQQLVKAETEAEKGSSSSSSSSSDDEVEVAPHSTVKHQPAATAAPVRSRRRFQRRLHAAAQAAAARQTSPPLHAPSSGSRAVVAYYGLVVQSARRHRLPEAASHASHAAGGQYAASASPMHPLGEVDGCFLLKTVQNRDSATGCTCTHFTLTQVCHQQPLYDQLQNAWLTHT